MSTTASHGKQLAVRVPHRVPSGTADNAGHQLGGRSHLSLSGHRHLRPRPTRTLAVDRTRASPCPVAVGAHTRRARLKVSATVPEHGQRSRYIAPTCHAAPEQERRTSATSRAPTHADRHLWRDGTSGVMVLSARPAPGRTASRTDCPPVHRFGLSYRAVEELLTERGSRSTMSPCAGGCSASLRSSATPPGPVATRSATVGSSTRPT